MADPVVVKVSALAEITDLQSGDLITVVDISEPNVANKTKKLQAGNIKIFNANQLGDNVVTQAAIGDGQVTLGKHAANSVDLSKLTANSVDASKIVDGSIPAGKLGVGAALGNITDGSIPATRLGVIKRTVAIPVFGLEDIVFQKNFTNIFRWPMTLDGHSVTGVRAVILDALSSNGGIGVAIINAGGTVSSFTIAQGARAETAGITAAYKASVIDQPVSVNITYSGTTAKGLIVFLEVTG